MSKFASLLSRAAVNRKKQLNKRRAEQGNNRKKGGKGKGSGKGGFWENEIKIKGTFTKDNGEVVEGKTQLLRLIPGEYKVPPHVLDEMPDYADFESLPCYLHMHYRHKTVPVGNYYGVEVLDTRDWADGKDLSIHMMEQGDDSVYGRIFTYYSVLSLMDWHEVDKEIQVRDRETGQMKPMTVKKWVPCDGVGCDWCEAGIEKVHGKAGYICLSPNNEEALNRLENTISQFCQCGSSEPIQVLEVACSGCGHVFWSAEFDDDGEILNPITPEDIQKLYDKHARCPGCDMSLQEFPEEGVESVYLTETINCNACGNARRATLYHADLALKKEGTGPSTRLALDMTKFKARGFRIRPLPSDLEDKIEVFDFHDKLKTTPAIVGKRVKVAPRHNPFVEDAKGAQQRKPKTNSSRY